MTSQGIDCNQIVVINAARPIAAELQFEFGETGSFPIQVELLLNDGKTDSIYHEVKIDQF